MKTLILFTIFILPSLGGVGGGLYAQIVNIPDPIFKARLIVEGVDTNHDGEIQVSEAQAVTGMLDVSIFFADPIYDLTGIEAFINITGLDVWGNQLTSLDLSSNTLLIELKCTSNNLNYLNVENCPNLETLMAYNNQITSIDLSQNINLKEVSLYNNHLTSVDLTPNIHLERVYLETNQLTYLDIRNGSNNGIEHFMSINNPNLTCIFVDDAVYSENAPGWYKDSASTYVETQAECDALSIENIALETIYLHPNPVQDKLYLHIPGENLKLNINIIDVSGKEISSHNITESETELNLSFIQPGIYFLILKNELNKTILTKKLIKL